MALTSSVCHTFHARAGFGFGGSTCQSHTKLPRNVVGMAVRIDGPRNVVDVLDERAQMVDDFGVLQTLGVKARNCQALCGATNFLGKSQVDINNAMIGSGHAEINFVFNNGCGDGMLPILPTST